MPQLIFRGARIRYADLRYRDEAGKFARLHISADWSTTVRDRMGWSDVPTSVSQAKLDGELAAHSLILTPASKELKQSELQIECSEVSDFQVVRIKDDQEGATHSELRFVARSNQADAAALVEAYLGVVGQGPAQLRVTHEKQEGLDFSGGEETEGNADSAEEAEPKTPEPAPLASVVEMNGGTPRRAQRRLRKGEQPLSTITKEDFAAEENADPNVPHHLGEAVQ